MQGKELKCMHEIVFQGRVGGLRIRLGREQFFVDSDQFLSFAGLFAETVIGDAIKPGGKFCLTPKAPDVFVGAQESLLCQIISQREIASRELPQKPADDGLMITDQLSEGVVIVLQ